MRSKLFNLESDAFRSFASLNVCARSFLYASGERRSCAPGANRRAAHIFRVFFVDWRVHIAKNRIFRKNKLRRPKTRLNRNHQPSICLSTLKAMSLNNHEAEGGGARACLRSKDCWQPNVRQQKSGPKIVRVVLFPFKFCVYTNFWAAAVERPRKCTRLFSANRRRAGL